MSISIQPKTDYSSIVSQSLQTRGSGSGVFAASGMADLTNTVLSGSGDNTLADYASIKNGSYGKLMKSYYTEVGNEKVAEAKKAASESATKKTSDKKTDSKVSESTAKDASKSTAATETAKTTAKSSELTQKDAVSQMVGSNINVYL